MSGFLINPFVFAAGGDFESIATVTVGSGGASSIEFTSIPGTFAHLQIRMIARSASSGSQFVNVQINSDSTLSNYARHLLYGNGSSVGAAASTGASTITNLGRIAGTSESADIFGAFVVDIVDYADTSKNKVFRSLGGYDANGSGEVDINSILWMDTSAITSVLLQEYSSANFAEHTTAALFGIRA